MRNFYWWCEAYKFLNLLAHTHANMYLYTSKPEDFWMSLFLWPANLLLARQAPTIHSDEKVGTRFFFEHCHFRNKRDWTTKQLHAVYSLSVQD